MSLTWGRRCRRASPQSVPTAMPAIGQRNICRLEGWSRGANPKVNKEGRLITKSAREAHPSAEIPWPCLTPATQINRFQYHTWTQTVHTHTSEETLTGSVGLSVLLCVSQTYPAVNLIEESGAEEGEVSGSDVGGLTQPEVPQELRDVQTLWQETKNRRKFKKPI